MADARVKRRKRYEVAKEDTGALPEHFVFPAGGKDPTRAMKDWRSAWRKIRKAAGLDGLRFHDGRHNAITIAGEKGVAEQTMLALFGDIDREMLNHYSHTRRQALRQAVAALEPAFMNRPHSTTNEAEMVN